MRLGIIGSQGFIGGGISRTCEETSGVEWCAVPRIPLGDASVADPAGVIAAVERTPRVHLDHLTEVLSRCDVVVNAAGLADPGSTDVATLSRTNVLLPMVLDKLAAVAGVSRIVHVSSASVQAGCDTLDEQPNWMPTSEYGRSKVAAERWLLEYSKVQTTLYRGVSIMGPNRAATERLIRFYGRRVVPFVVAGGDQGAALPISALPNTTRALVQLAREGAGVKIALQPWEGVTQAGLAASLASATTRLIRVPVPHAAGSIALRLSHHAPARVAGHIKRVSLFLAGVRQNAQALNRIGFVPAVYTPDYLAGLLSQRTPTR